MNNFRTERALVVERTGPEKIRVKVDRNDACSECKMRGTCNPFGTHKMVFEALDRFDSQVGEEVVVTFGSMGRGQAMIVLYGLPLVAFLIGAIVGNQLALFGSPDLSGLVLSLVATAVAMAGIRLYSIRNFEQDKEYQPVVSKRLGYPVPEPEEDPC